MTNKAVHHTYICLGKTGAGKSSLCNKIICKNVFMECDSGTSVTSAPQLAESSINHGIILTVVDTPGVMDTSVNSYQAKKKSCDEMIEAMGQCPKDGIRALLLVLKYGDRFTEENRKCVDIIETIFGDQCLDKCCIVVFTHGEVFDINNEERNISFEAWCRTQQGDLKVLLQRCGYRCLLFRNKTRDSEVRRQQIESLIQMADELDESYTQEKFKVARKKHKRLHLESKLPDLIRDYDKQLNELQEKVNGDVLRNISLQQLLCLKKEGGDILLKLQLEDEGIYYREGELSLFHQQIIRARQMVKQIHIQLIWKIKDKLTKRLFKYQFKVTNCKNCNELDRLKDTIKEGLQKYLELGLVIDDNVTIDADRNNLGLQSEDLPSFDDVNNLLEKLNALIKENENVLKLNETYNEFQKKIKILKKRLNLISQTERNDEQIVKILDGVSKLKDDIPSHQSFKNLIDKLIELEKDATMKIEQCKRNKKNFYIGIGTELFTMAVGATGHGIGFIDHDAAQVCSKIAPDVVTLGKTIVGFAKKGTF